MTILSVPDLYEMKSMQEAGVSPSSPATWCGLPLRGGGITTCVDLWKYTYPTGKFLINLKGLIGGQPVNNGATWGWANSTGTGKTLYNIWRPNVLTPWHVRWPVVALSSVGPNYPPQYGAIDAYSADGVWARLAGIPYSTDYSKLTVEFMAANGYGGAAYSAFTDGTYRLSANGYLFFVPYFSSGFPAYSAGFDGQLWIKRSYLRRQVGQAALLPVVS